MDSVPATHLGTVESTARTASVMTASAKTSVEKSVAVRENTHTLLRIAGVQIRLHIYLCKRFILTKQHGTGPGRSPQLAAVMATV